jgi:hypothetical protein
MGPKDLLRKTYAHLEKKWYFSNGSLDEELLFK